MTAKGRAQVTPILQQETGHLFVGRIRLPFFRPDRYWPAILRGQNGFVVPVGTLDKTNCNWGAAASRPVSQVVQILFGVAQVGLDGDAYVGPVAKLRFLQDLLKESQSEIFISVLLHIDVHKRPAALGFAQNRP